MAEISSTTLLRYSLHTTEFTYFKCTPWQVLLSPYSCIAIPTTEFFFLNGKHIFIFQKQASEWVLYFEIHKAGVKSSWSREAGLEVWLGHWMYQEISSRLLQFWPWVSWDSPCCCCCVTLVVSNSVWPQRRQLTRLPVPRILQARTLEWLAISFSNA